MSMSGIIKATVYIVRHGECDGNVAQKALDPFTDLLTDIGKAQAEVLGKCLKKIPFTRAYASDYPRAFETARLILQQSENVTEDILKPEKQIRERDYTGIVGYTATAAIDIMIDSMKQGSHYLEVEMPGSETVQQFENRLIGFMSELIKDLRSSQLSEESILIVSHGLTNQRLMILLNQRAKDFGIQNWTCNPFSEKLMRNTTLHELVFEIPRDNFAPVSGRVEYAHFREHINGDQGEVVDYTRKSRVLSDENNYTFLNKLEATDFENQTVHYCKPV